VGQLGAAEDNVTEVKYILIVDSVNCKVSCVSVGALRDNDFYKNYLFIFLFLSSTVAIYRYTRCNIRPTQQYGITKKMRK
jgi:hypothetical protein